MLNVQRDAYYKKHPVKALTNSPSKIALWGFAGLITTGIIVSQFVSTGKSSSSSYKSLKKSQA
jgi:hypothetical protein